MQRDLYAEESQKYCNEKIDTQNLLSQLYEEIEKLKKYKEEFNSDNLKLKDEKIKDLSQLLDHYKLTAEMNQKLLEEEKLKVKLVDKKEENDTQITFNSGLKQFIYKLLEEIAILKYKNKKSINLKLLNDTAIQDYNFLIGTLFLENKVSSNTSYFQPIFWLQEYLENIFIKLNKLDKNTKLNSSHIKEIANSVMNSSIIDCHYNLITENTEFDLNTELSNVFLNSEGIKESLGYDNIRNKIFENINKFDIDLSNNIFNLILKCKDYIDNENKNVIFESKILFPLEKSQINYVLKNNDLVIVDKFDNNEKIIGLLNLLKYQGKDISSFCICQGFNSEVKDIYLNGFSNIISVFCRKISNLAILENTFNLNQFYFICKIISFKNLVLLDLSNNSLIDDNIKEILDSIKCRNTLKSLNFSKNLLSNRSLHYICIYLCKPNILDQLNLSSNQIGTEGLKYIIESTQSSNFKLQLLNLASNKFNKSQSAAFCSILNKKSTLKSFNLSKNQFDSAFYTEFSKSLKSLESIRILLLEDMNFKNGDIENLFSSKSINLHEIHLSYNNLDNNDYNIICKILKNNNNLKMLSLKKTNMKIRHLIIIINAFANHSYLEVIDARFNFLELDFESAKSLIMSVCKVKFKILISIRDGKIKDALKSMKNIILSD